MSSACNSKLSVDTDTSSSSNDRAPSNERLSFSKSGASFCTNDTLEDRGRWTSESARKAALTLSIVDGDMDSCDDDDDDDDGGGGGGGGWSFRVYDDWDNVWGRTVVDFDDARDRSFLVDS